MNKLLIIGAMLVLLVGGISYVNQDYEEDIKSEEKQYQGPVPLGYDLEYFRETGETIKESIE